MRPKRPAQYLWIPLVTQAPNGPRNRGHSMDVTAKTWVVVPEVVVVQVRLLVRILPGEPQGELERAEPAGVLIRGIAAEGVGVVPAPDGPLLLVRDEARGC